MVVDHSFLAQKSYQVIHSCSINGSNDAGKCVRLGKFDSTKPIISHDGSCPLKKISTLLFNGRQRPMNIFIQIDGCNFHPLVRNGCGTNCMAEPGGGVVVRSQSAV